MIENAKSMTSDVPDQASPQSLEAGSGAAVAVIEDDEEIRRFLRAALTSQGFRLFEAETAEAGLTQVATCTPDIIILDLGLPDMDGLEVIRRLREWTSVPIIVLSARGLEPDKIAALDAGADDYVSKPFGIGELLARMRVAMRHAAQVGEDPGSSVFSMGNIEMDLAYRRVRVNGQEVHLTPIEYRLMHTLLQHSGKVLTHRQLLSEVWGQTYTEQTHYLRVYMAQLRRKLEADPARPRYILTEPGVGYRLASE